MNISPETAAHQFCTNPLWAEAQWIATTYQWHPTSDAPPLMGLVFADWLKGIEIFRGWVDALGNADENDDIRVAITEGEVAGQAPGYNVRISQAVAEYLDDAEAQFVGQVQRMHPQLGGKPDMLPRFKQEYIKHGQFMLAPVVIRDDDQLYFNVHQGIIKRELFVRDVSQIADDELDGIALRRTAGSGLLLQKPEDRVERI